MRRKIGEFLGVARVLSHYFIFDIIRPRDSLDHEFFVHRGCLDSKYAKIKECRHKAAYFDGDVLDFIKLKCRYRAGEKPSLFNINQPLVC